jgi:hypothetical protein
MTEHGWPSDAWPGIYQKILAADILVLAGPIWLGDNSSVTKQVIERLYACSHLLNQAGQYEYCSMHRAAAVRRAAGRSVSGSDLDEQHVRQPVHCGGRTVPVTGPGPPSASAAPCPPSCAAVPPPCSSAGMCTTGRLPGLRLSAEGRVGKWHAAVTHFGDQDAAAGGRRHRVREPGLHVAGRRAAGYAP